MKLLYVVNFYGTPPLNYFGKYVKDNELFDLTILKLPSVRPMKNKFLLDAFLEYHDGSREKFNISIWFPFPLYVVFACQYLLNFVAFVYLVLKSKHKSFDVAIGETSFGSSMVYLLRKFGIVKYGVYMDGDILPDKKGRDKPFYFQTNSAVVRIIDRFLISIQYFLRKQGLKNDLIWYPSEKVREWDILGGFLAKDVVKAPAVTLHADEVEKNLKVDKEKHTLCFIGRHDEHAGVDIALRAIKIVKETIPDIRFESVGGGSLTVERYEQMADDLGIKENVKLHGYIPEMDDAIKILSKGTLGLALYMPSKDNVSLYTDVGKPKEYLKAGVPVLITKDGPMVAEDIGKYNGGVLVDYDENAIAQTIIDILTNGSRLEELREGVAVLGNHFDYESEYSRLTSKIIARYEKFRDKKL